MYTFPNTLPFALGQTVITKAARESLYPDDILMGLRRHAARDWGEVDSQDWTENDCSLQNGLRLISAYRDRAGNKFWVVTEADRRATTVLLPEDY